MAGQYILSGHAGLMQLRSGHRVSGGFMRDGDNRMNIFLASVERRAFCMARVSAENRDDALDIVQDTMFRMVRSYRQKPEKEWRPIFFRILQNRIRDYRRRGRIRRRLQVWLPFLNHTENGQTEDPVNDVQDQNTPDPMEQAAVRQSIAALEAALRTLPVRQQQVFLLRAWEGMSVKEAAFVMKCSEGTVKTHYSRAVHRLREMLEDWEG